jgi:hypothetical protein
VKGTNCQLKVDHMIVLVVCERKVRGVAYMRKCTKYVMN